MRKFESHITFDRDDSAIIQQMLLTYNSAWQFSAIDGDPLMGKLPYAYLTAYDTNGADLLARAMDVQRVLAGKGVVALRIKVEEIVYDSRTGYNALSQG
jgi:hypothetical protein